MVWKVKWINVCKEIKKYCKIYLMRTNWYCINIIVLLLFSYLMYLVCHWKIQYKYKSRNSRSPRFLIFKLFFILITRIKIQSVFSSWQHRSITIPKIKWKYGVGFPKPIDLNYKFKVISTRTRLRTQLELEIINWFKGMKRNVERELWTFVPTAIVVFITSFNTFF